MVSFNTLKNNSYDRRLFPGFRKRNTIWVSFDVVSLFTNVPMDLAIGVRCERWDKSEEWKMACMKSRLTKDDVNGLLKICIDIATFVNDTVQSKQFMERQWGHPCLQ